ncbi:uncharacterized membrane protein YccF (DUF307 family) [Saccharothrix tamanrassetensis]|uniref:Uncharacterized membrane protein YccF (DUF307 family) n=1 Tax=Saccharothrix tamanrassetensis TaxID=1051531 RepID=A0A841CU61_9PSEU|nr:hypothetical protein [Saccharothrix tamanrassetensis]MBB5960383.1 uncharacterized membrane protein YccF (DUF307 family) [Saccharothrix tamanrassetensis]
MANALVQQAHNQARDVERAIREFFDQVNDVLSWVPDALGHLVRPIEQGMAAVARAVRDFWDRVNRLWDQPGDADRLRATGERWTAGVGRVVDDIADTIEPHRLRTDVEWAGRAARAYQKTVLPQSQGLKDVKDLSDQVRTSLTNLANSVDAFWMAIGFAFGGFLVAMAIAIAEACSVVGIPAAIATVLTAVGAAVGLLGTAVLAMEAHFNSIEAEQLAIRQKAEDIDSTWQRPNTADLADATVRDGDRPDWEPA